MLNICRRKRHREGSSRAGRFVATLPSRRIRRASFFIFACWLLLNSSPQARSQNEESVEYPVKLAFLFNFTKFVEWPADSFRGASAPMSICIVGDDPFSADLEGELRTRSVGGHPVAVKRLKPTDTLSMCQMVFVPVTAKDQSARIVKGLKGASTLTVGEAEGFAVLGGIINLTVEGNKLHFEVNLSAAERAKLKISSKLLSMAKIIKEQASGGRS
jgi:uncharacterized protein DUF4154